MIRSSKQNVIYLYVSDKADRFVRTLAARKGISLSELVDDILTTAAGKTSLRSSSKIKRRALKKRTRPGASRFSKRFGRRN